MLNNKENRTINQLIGATSGKETSDSGYLVSRVEELHNIPIADFEIEDYRMLINQGIALEYLVTPAIDILSHNLFAEGDYFEGDLLKSVLTIDKSFWEENPTLKNELKQICLRDFHKIEFLDLSDEIKESLHSLVTIF